MQYKFSCVITVSEMHEKIKRISYYTLERNNY